MPIDAVIAKGGPDGNVYIYDPESLGDTGLVSPINTSNGMPYGISHISFCYDYEVQVTKTAATSLARTFAWGITKSGDQTELVLSPGQSYLVNYVVTLFIEEATDSDWAVSGEITIHNPAPIAATLASVTDAMGDVVGIVDCGVTFPYELAAGDTLVCSYAASLPDGSTRLNLAEVTGAVRAGLHADAWLLEDPLELRPGAVRRHLGAARRGHSVLRLRL